MHFTLAMDLDSKNVNYIKSVMDKSDPDGEEDYELI
jgi:hypothetical protein